MDNSFLNLQAHSRDAMWVGPANIYTGGLDANNPLYFKKDVSDAEIIVVNPGVIADAESGDLRVQDKFYKRSDPASFEYIPYKKSGLPNIVFPYQMYLYHSLNASIPFIRNEELILIYTEAKAQTSKPHDAIDALNTIRTTWGLNSMGYTSDKSKIIDQLLKQRRYSLWMEGQRWIDMKRYGRLDQIDTGYDGGRVPKYLARPQGELDWGMLRKW